MYRRLGDHTIVVQVRDSILQHVNAVYGIIGLRLRLRSLLRRSLVLLLNLSSLGIHLLDRGLSPRVHVLNVAAVLGCQVVQFIGLID